MKEKYRYEMMSPVARANKPVRILERDKQGLLIAEYTGYYRPRSGTFVLYPNRNPFSAGRDQVKKKEIYAEDVRYKKTNTERI